MRALEFIRDHVTFKLPYDFSYQMKKTQVSSLTILVEVKKNNQNRKAMNKQSKIDLFTLI